MIITNKGLEKTSKEVSIDIRMCQECNTTLFSKRDFALSLSQTPASVRSYDTLIQFETGIRKLLPSFHRHLQALQDPDNPPSSSTIAEASKIRKRLIDSFGKYDLAAKRIRDLPTGGSEAQEKLQKAIYRQAEGFLHLHMLSLKSLPRLLKHATPNGTSAKSHQQSHLSPHHNAIKSIKTQDQTDDTSSVTSTAISTMEAEEKELREQLIVLEEQRFMVKEMVRDAVVKRRFEEVESLRGNLGDLEREIDAVGGRLAALDFEGAYLGGSGDLA